jgi:peptide deformylase
MLHKKSREVASFDDKLWVLLDDMYETLQKHEGVGIAAVQVGILRRVIVLDMGDGIIEIINPVIIHQKGDQRELEGCLSCPGLWGYVTRPSYLKITSQNRRGEAQVHEATELFAIALSHELDHLEGVVFPDVADEMVDEPTEEQLENRPSRRLRRKKKKR